MPAYNEKKTGSEKREADLRRALRDEKTGAVPEEIFVNFADTLAEFEARGVAYLDEAYVCALESEYGIFGDKFGFITDSLRLVRECEGAALYSLLTAKMIGRRTPGAHPALLDLTAVPDEDALAYEMAPFFAELAYARSMVDGLRSRGVPEEETLATLRYAFCGSITVAGMRLGRDGFLVSSHFVWIMYFLNLEILSVGVLNFEMRRGFTSFVRVFKNKNGEYKLLVNGQKLARGGQHGESFGQSEYLTAEITETDSSISGYDIDTRHALSTMERVTLDKSEWQEAIAPDGRVINVHIPMSDGFCAETIADAYKRVRKIIKASFPEYADAPFVCTSWLMDPLLENYLKPTSNILAFQSDYMLFPVKSYGKAAITYLFNKSPDTPISELPERTSLQRKVKELYQSGGCIYGASGIFFPKD